MNEFDMIEKYFLPLTMGQAGPAGLRDDAAILTVPAGRDLVVSSDTLNEGVHFLSGDTPENIARKVIRVNLSDLAAMGADPLCYQLNLAFPERPGTNWLERFTGALMENQKAYEIYCSGGDTTSILGGVMSISVTVMGTVPSGKAVRRGGAKGGDLLVMTGPVGDAALGLKILQERDFEKKAAMGQACPYALQRCRRPEPRVDAAALVREYAHAAVDISDGVLADIGHICEASGLGAYLSLGGFRYSKDVRHALREEYITIQDILGGGDDYELALAVPERNVETLLEGLRKLNLSPFVAGVFESDISGVHVFDTDGFEVKIETTGWVHF
ncbi:MAG: thiamine-phosphate kinase [Alphaproteobacteria bacterium]|nr:thiamine-phosphate kinase [Alphaproteobacteria bacterium]